MQSELKACPFCGHEQPKLFGESAPEWWVGCPACRASTECRTNQTDAIAAWNTRAEGDAQKQIATLRSIIRDFLECVDEPPERNCSCPISPPCSDCVEYAYLRETFSSARAALAAPASTTHGHKPFGAASAEDQAIYDSMAANYRRDSTAAPAAPRLPLDPTKEPFNTFHNPAVDAATESAPPISWMLGGEVLPIFEGDENTRLTAPAAPMRSDDHYKPPFDNCSFRLCDLPGQCRSEGKCHHPATVAAPQVQPSEIQALVQMADAALHQTADDMRNIMEDIAQRLTDLLSRYGAAPQGGEDAREVLAPFLALLSVARRIPAFDRAAAHSASDGELNDAIEACDAWLAVRSDNRA